MDKKIILSGLIVVVLVSLLYTSYAPGSSFPTGLTVAGQSRYTQLKACVDSGQDLNTCRLAVGSITLEEFARTRGGGGGTAGGGQAIAGAAVVGLPSKEELHQLILANWPKQKQKLMTNVVTEFTRARPGRTETLYAIQPQTNALLRYAGKKKDITLLNELAELYLVPLQYLETITTSLYSYLPKNLPPEGSQTPEAMAGYYRSVEPLPHPVRTWTHDPSVNAESTLQTGQFLSVVSDAYVIFLSIPPEQRTPNMRRFLQEYSSILKEHYFRWIFEDTMRYGRKGWACQPEKGPGSEHTNQYDFLVKLYNLEFASTTGNPNPSCNYLGDADLWVGVGAANLLRANAKAVENGEQALLTDDERAKLQDYMGVVTRLTRSRLTESRLTDFNGNPVVGYNFDLDNSLADDPEEGGYAGYTGESYPTEAQKIKVPRIGWDLSHASRFVYIFTTLFDAKHATGQDWPREEDMTKFVNQFLYGVFNKNLERPLFTNFFDGTNGWYRVNYEGHEGTGFAPYGLSTAGISSGWGLWYRFNNDLGPLMASLWKVMRATDQVDRSGNNLRASLDINAEWTEQGKLGAGIHTSRAVAKRSIDCGMPAVVSSPQGSFETWVKFDEQNKHEDILHIYEPNKGGNGLYVKKVGTTRPDGTTIEQEYQNRLWIQVKEGEQQKINKYSRAMIGDTTWHHIVLVQDGAELKVYIDGTKSELFGASNSGYWTSHINLAASTAVCSIGSSEGFGTDASAGTFDEVRFYNRALSDEEVRQHYAGQFVNNGGLVAYWSFSSANAGLIEHKREYYSGTRMFVNKQKRPPTEQFDLKDSIHLVPFLSSISDIVEGGAN